MSGLHEALLAVAGERPSAGAESIVLIADWEVHLFVNDGRLSMAIQKRDPGGRTVDVFVDPGTLNVTSA